MTEILLALTNGDAGASERLEAALTRLELTARAAGAQEERARIGSILSHPLASGCMLFAWRLAESGVDFPTAESLLRTNALAAAGEPEQPEMFN